MNKKHSPQWFKATFNTRYLHFYSHRNEEAAGKEISALLALLDLHKNDRILDLCCGAGRHLTHLAAQGYNAIGLDLSPELLATTREKSALSSRLVRGDMRALPFCSSFKCVFNLFSSFGYFDDENENEAALFEMSRILMTGGILVLDHMNRRRTERTLVSHSEDHDEHGTLVQDRRIKGNRVIKDLTWLGNNGITEKFTENVRMYSLEELTNLMEKCGLRVIHRFGDFTGVPFSPDSERMILIAIKESP